MWISGNPPVMLTESPDTDVPAQPFWRPRLLDDQLAYVRQVPSDRQNSVQLNLAEVIFA